MEKAIFIDLDGTLKNDCDIVTENTIDKISKIKELGYAPIICSGRPRDYVLNLNRKVNASKYIIYCTGAGIFDSESNKVMYESYMNPDDVLELYNIGNRKGNRVILVVDGIRHVNIMTKFDGSEILISEDIEIFLEKHQVIQVTISGTDFDLIKSMEQNILLVPNVQIINKSKVLTDSSYELSGKYFYDIVNNDTSKGSAIRILGNILDIEKDNRIAIGDDSNDICMFMECGFNVAMNNAIPIIKEMADYITDDNNHDGVANFLSILMNEYENNI